MHDITNFEKKDCFIPYTEPMLTNEVIYQSDSFILRKIWEWDIVAAYEAGETDILKCLLTGPCFSAGISTYIFPTGKRISSQNYTDTDDFYNGLALIRGENGKYGLMDRNLCICVPMEYDYPYEPCTENGFVVLKKDNIPHLFNERGEEIRINIDYTQYTIIDIENYRGVCVARIKGNYGGFHELTVDANGKVVSDKYQYGGAEDEDLGTDNLVFVTQCKDNILKRGAINKNLEEVIPCEFYELGKFWDREDFLQARIENKWGVIDNTGKWIVEPIFGDIGYELENNLITFYNEDKWFEPPVGVYDILQHKVLVEPRFEDIEFMSRDRLCVEFSDEITNYHKCQIIKIDGTVLYAPPFLSSIWEKDNFIIASFHEKGLRYNAILDKDLNEIVSATHKINIDKVFFNQKCFTFVKDNKKGLMSFDLDIMTEPIYDEIYASSYDSIKNDILVAKKDDKQGLITSNGKTILPLKYSSISFCKDNRILCNNHEGPTEMFQIEDIKEEER